jgi:hypothetical protein
MKTWPVLGSLDFRIKKLLEEIRQKYSLSELRKILKAEDLGSAPGWEKLTERFLEANGELKSRAEVLLKGLHGDLILAGTKDLQIFELADGQGVLIAEAFAAIHPASPSFGVSYPLSVAETVLRGLTFDHELTAKIEHKSGDVSLVFCARRTMEEQDRYKTNEVAAAVREAFNGYEEFIAIRRMEYQIFDVVTVRRALDRIEVLVDYPDRLRSQESTDQRVLALLGRLASSVPILTATYETNLPMNLFACINNLLQSKNEGRVSKLSFRSPTDSVKKEAMTANKDLRVEVFHKAGVEAVGAITPFDVTVAWESLMNSNGSVDVRIGAPISVLSASEPFVRTARITGARSASAVLAVVNKIVAYST